MSRWLLSLVCAGACGAAETSAPQHPAPTPPAPTAPATLTPASPPVTASPPATPANPALTGYPLARLAVPGNPIEALDRPLPADRLEALGVRSYRAFTATAPRVWLHVFEFADQAALVAKLADVGALLGGDDEPPYYRASTYTGAWLLVSGFPSHKPVSPEMEAARTAFVSAWAGEE